MNHFWEYIGMAFAGHIFYLCKQWLENYKRKQVFVPKVFIISEVMNTIAIFILIYIGIYAPTDWLVMTPIVSVLIGGFGSSMLSAIINTRASKEDMIGSISTAAPKDAELNNSNP